MADLKISFHGPHTSRYGPRLTDEEWEAFKPVLVALDDQGLSRKDIVQRAALDHGFRGTYAALNIRFKKWGLTTSRTIGDTATSGTNIGLVAILEDAPLLLEEVDRASISGQDADSEGIEPTVDQNSLQVRLAHSDFVSKLGMKDHFSDETSEPFATTDQISRNSCGSLTDATTLNSSDQDAQSIKTPPDKEATPVDVIEPFTTALTKRR